MTAKYVFNGTRMNPIIMKGAEKGQSTTAVELSDGSLRDLSPKRTTVTEKKFPQKFKTLMGDATFTLYVSMQVRQFEIGNPDTGKPTLTWDVRNLRVWSRDLVLPTGYDMWATPEPVKAALYETRTDTYPLVDIRLLVEVGPAVGTWTKYKPMIYLNPLKGTIRL